jgi:type VI protein secretion system component VasK
MGRAQCRSPVVLSMKPNQNPESDEKLSELLREWRPKMSLPPRFQERVWRRIERTEANAQLTFRQVVTHRVEAAFNRPSLAVSYVAVLLFVGLISGYWQAQGQSARAQAKLRTAYVQSVDPYQAPRN